MTKKAKTSNNYNLTENELKSFIEKYPNVRNADLAERFRLTINQVFLLGIKLKLKKVKKSKKAKLERKHKICSKCKKDKPIKDFNKESKSVDGHQAYCRLCSRGIKKKPKITANLHNCKSNDQTNAPEWWVEKNKQLLSQQKSH